MEDKQIFLQEIIEQIMERRNEQDEQWGYPQRNRPMEWGSILAEESGELCQALNNYQNDSFRGMERSERFGHKLKIVDEIMDVVCVAINIYEHLEDDYL